MGVFEKLKNALFEEEYYEVEEQPKKKREEKPKSSNKPIAKKVVLPEKKEKIEEIEEEELKNDDFEFRPKDDIDKEELVNKRSSFKILEDDDLKVEDTQEIRLNAIAEEKKKEEEPEVFDFRDDNGFKQVENSFDDYKEKDDTSIGYSFEKPFYSSSTYTESHVEKKPYGIDKNNEIHISDYGSYDKFEEKKVFRPTPVISPIYGVLDKNYKKDDIVQKTGVSFTSSFTRSNVSIDDIRKKAYGNEKKNDIEDEFEEDIVDNSNSFEINKEEENLLVDLTESDKPSVKEVTMGDAMEYFEDLGLEYNVDYVDQKKSNEKTLGVKEVKTPKRITPDIDLLSDEQVVPERKEEVKIEKKESKKETLDTDNDSDDNLFDLIDSMYQE